GYIRWFSASTTGTPRSGPMRCHLACLAVEEPQVGWPHWCHLPRFGTLGLGWEAGLRVKSCSAGVFVVGQDSLGRCSAGFDSCKELGNHANPLPVGVRAWKGW